MAKFLKKNKGDSPFNVNDEIPNYDKVILNGEGVNENGISMFEARKIANSMEMDLVEIKRASGKFPVIKIVNYEKMMYNLKKQEKNAKRKTNQLKEIQLSVNIAKHDLETKANKAKEFINDGDKVKVVLRMKGRELSRREENKRSILEFIVMLEDVANVEGNIKDDGNNTIAILKKKKQ